MTGKTHRLYYGWVIVAVSFTTTFLALGIRFCSGVFYVAMLGEYAWSRAETAGAFSVAMVIHALFAPVTGTLIDRFGPRKLFPLGATILVIGLVAASRITAVWHLYLFFGVVVAIGINSLSFTPHMSLIPKWFVRKRGFASGLVLAGIGVGTMVLAPFIQFINDTLGWRFAFLILAGIILGVVVPMTLLFQRRSPEEVSQYPDGIVPGSNGTLPRHQEGFQEDMRSSALSGQWTLRAALGTKPLWWMILMNFCNGFQTYMLVVHQAAHIVDAGYSRILAASLVGLVSLLASAGGIVCGFLSDRVGREIAYTLGGSAASVGILFFLFVWDTTFPWILYAFVILYGLGCGAMAAVVAAAAGDLFRGNSLGRILGIMTTGFGLGGALGGYIGGYLYDIAGNYTLPFLLVLVSIGVGILGIWMAAPRHRRPFAKAVDG